jgi:transcriptional regulator with XRE-family HTH domain
MVRDGSDDRDRDWAEAFGTVVGRLMADRDTTAYRVARRIGRPVNTVNRYYLGQRVPPATVLAETARVLDIDVSALVAAVGAVADRLHAERTGGKA